jgi:protein-S-isoprenylcysteine O-methyltransferase Ste14
MSIAMPSEITDSPAAIATSEREATAAAEPRGRRGMDLFLDLFERFLVAGFFCWLVGRLVADYLIQGNPRSLLAIPSEGLVVVFIVIRRFSHTVSHRPTEWLIALTVTCVPFLVDPPSDQAALPMALVTFCALVWLIGFIVQLHAKLSLGRSLGCVPAHRGLRLQGPYRFVRHPMYAGYLLTHVAILSLNSSLWNLGVYCVCYALLVPRILMEERLLSEDPCYREYQAKVRSRLIPGVF